MIYCQMPTCIFLDTFPILATGRLRKDEDEKFIYKN